VQGRTLISQSVLDLYSKYLSGGRPSLQEIVKTLHSVLDDYSSVYLVIDALDECPERDGTRSQLLTKIQDLQKEAKADLHLMATSRFIKVIEEEVKPATRIEVRASEEDVKKFVAGQMYRIRGVVKNDIKLEDLVRDKIAQTVDGMSVYHVTFRMPLAYDPSRFLLARLYFDFLLDKNTKKEVKSALEKLSTGDKKKVERLYDEAYNKVLERIEGQLPGNRDMAKKVLSWITYAKRPLTKKELCHALAVELGKLDEEHIADIEDIASVCRDLITVELDEENIPPFEHITSLCGGLLTVDEDTNIVRLIHYTTQEYFERIREKWFPGAQLKIASTCLIYLCFDAFRSGPCPSERELESRLHQNVFLNYAALYWGYHVLTVQEEVSELAVYFLQDSNLVSSAVQALDRRLRLVVQETGLHLTANFGLVHLCDKLLSGVDTEGLMSADSMNEKSRTPLSFAAEMRHEAVIKLLLDTGKAEVDSKDLRYRTPLSWPAENGHEGVVQLLLEHKANIEQKNSHGVRALHIAALEGHDKIVQLLLEHKANVEEKNSHRVTALYVAARIGTTVTLKFETTER
jgi:hypothetical protein